MRFIEKDLETIIWEDPDFCLDRGLSIEPCWHTRYRQLNLTPFGIADLVYLGWVPLENALRVQIIECKKDRIDTATYLQAKRYQTALSHIVEGIPAMTRGYEIRDIQYDVYLIGRQVEKNIDFVNLLTLDSNAHVFTYEYKADGIHFNRYDALSTLGDHYKKGATNPGFSAQLQDDLSKRIRDSDAMWAGFEQQEYQQSLPLLITDNKVLVNEKAVNLDANGTD
ncbi:hypothetical protein [Hymenobacter tenuis]